MDLQLQSITESSALLSSSGLFLNSSEPLISTNDLVSLPSALNANPELKRNGLVVSDLLVPGRVVASGSLPQGAMSVPIEPKMLIGDVDVQQISVDVTSFGTLDLDKKAKEIWSQNVHWIRAIRLSDDCHSYNIQLKLQPSHRIYPHLRNGPMPKLILQVVRPVEVGQELQLWFSEDILAMLQVVFLSPSNIQGQKKYVCNRCSTLYESPNPLKLHITLACGKYPISTLWERLATLTESQSIRNVVSKGDGFNFKLEPQSKQRNALDLTVEGLNTENKGLHRPYAECSAFKPFRKQLEINGNAAVDPRIIREIPAIWPSNFETDVVQLHRNLMQNGNLAPPLVYSDDAQIESLVSSLGKAKQGHICLYCGKCYSRKYGLKIHIRTHTGYKPLKCKFCERPFGDPSNLNKHVRLHAEGNTPYKCELCGKILVRRRDLERHLKSRHMIEIHPGQNILPDSPASTNDGSNSQSEKIDDNAGSPIKDGNKTCDKDHDEDEEVKVIDIYKEEVIDSEKDVMDNN